MPWPATASSSRPRPDPDRPVTPVRPEPRTRHLFRLEVNVTRQIVGQVPEGYARRAGIVSGGRFTGDRLSGAVLPGGGDWPRQRPDKGLALDVRLMLRTDDGDTVYMTYTGRLIAPEDVRRRMAAGGTAHADEMYFRTLVQFEAATDARVAWLNDIVAVGIGSNGTQGPGYEVYELL